VVSVGPLPNVVSAGKNCSTQLSVFSGAGGLPVIVAGTRVASGAFDEEWNWK
jgi:hypothetical protein